MCELTKLAKSLQQDLQSCHDKTENNSVPLKHILRKVSEGEIVIAEKDKEECIRLLRKLKTTTHEFSDVLHKLTSLVEFGQTVLDRKDQAAADEQRSEHLKSISQRDESSLRGSSKRVSADSGIGSRASSILYENFRASESENLDMTLISPQHQNDLDRRPMSFEPKPPDFYNLNVSSLQSGSLNLDSTGETNFGKLLNKLPERDSVAFANTIACNDRSLLDAQGRAVHGLHRSMTKTQADGLQIDDDYYSHKEYEA